MIVEEINGVKIVKLSGELDFEAYLKLREPLHKLLEQSGVRVLIDLSGVHRITTPGWSILLSAIRKATESGGVVKLVSLPNHLTHAFLSLRLETVFELFEDVGTALKTFGVSPFEAE